MSDELKIPKGWAMVPVEPTGRILKAMTFAGTDGSSTMAEAKRMRSAYKAMLDAAPHPSENNTEERT